MTLPLVVAVAWLAIGQAGSPSSPPLDEPEPEAKAARPARALSTWAPEAASPGAVEIDGASGLTGVPFIPGVSMRDRSTPGSAFALGLMSLVRGQSLAVTGDGPAWAWDLEVTPGVGFATTSPNVDASAGYGVRLTVPIDAAGAPFAALQQAYARVGWRIAPLWTLGASVSGTYGEYSQLQPVTTPGSAGSPPPALNPVRTFSSYPYLGLSANASVETQFSARTRLRISGTYVDVGGIGSEGSAVQPRTWGPSGSATLDWNASAQATLSTNLAYQDSIMTGQFAIQVGALTEMWRQQWTPDLESFVSAGAALTSTDSGTFIGFGHLLPVASAGISYTTDARRSMRLGLDLALAPYVDTTLRMAYQRATARLALDWRPSTDFYVGLNVAGAIVPYSAGAPDVYGTGGFSVSWLPVPILAVNVGGYTQSQFQGNSAIPGFFQWTVYLGLAFEDRIGL